MLSGYGPKAAAMTPSLDSADLCTLTTPAYIPKDAQLGRLFVKWLLSWLHAVAQSHQLDRQACQYYCG
jgi:hypothetical protein